MRNHQQHAARGNDPLQKIPIYVSLLPYPSWSYQKWQEASGFDFPENRIRQTLRCSQEEAKEIKPPWLQKPCHREDHLGCQTKIRVHLALCLWFKNSQMNNTSSQPAIVYRVMLEEKKEMIMMKLETDHQQRKSSSKCKGKGQPPSETPTSPCCLFSFSEFYNMIRSDMHGNQSKSGRHCHGCRTWLQARNKEFNLIYPTGHSGYPAKIRVK